MICLAEPRPGMMKLGCCWYGTKIGGLTGRLTSSIGGLAAEWEMSLVAGKAVNQINSTHYSRPEKKCPRVSIPTIFRWFPVVHGGSKRWRFTVIYGGSKTRKSISERFVSTGRSPQFSSHFEYWPRLQPASLEMWFESRRSWNEINLSPREPVTQRRDPPRFQNTCRTRSRKL